MIFDLRENPGTRTGAALRHAGKVTRREALSLLAASTAVCILPVDARSQTRPPSIPGARDVPELNLVPYSEPPVIRSEGGELSTTLTVQLRREEIDGKPAIYRTYNGLFTGPTLRFRPGDEVNILLDNQLPPEEGGHGGEVDMSEPHGFNTTNLHTHGLWVSPQSPADDVLLSIGPGESFQHRYEIEPKHVSGTYWYHPHKHGSVERQVSQGMSGALIIEGGIDELPGIREAVERIMVFQQIQPDPDPVLAASRKSVLDIAGPPNKTTTINGLRGPTIVMAPGGIERWRLIAANYHDFLHFEVRHIETGMPLELHPIAWDGIPVRKVKARTRISLTPGNRADILVQPPREGIYQIWKIGDGGQFDVKPDDELIGFLIAGPPPSEPVVIPQEISEDYSHPDITEPVDRIRKVVFSILRKDGKAYFLVDGKEFDPNRIDHLIKLDTVEEWRIENTSNAMHPFHIHVNPFQIVEISDGSIEPGRWLDTVHLPPGTEENPGYVIMRTRIRKFTGKFVQHCHILAHEDRGMMQIVQIE